MCQERLKELEILSTENEWRRKNIDEVSYYISWRYIQRILNNSGLLKAVALILRLTFKRSMTTFSQASTLLMKRTMARIHKGNL